MGNKKQTLKEMQEELLQLVIEKYYKEDEQLMECVDKIVEKTKKLESDKIKRNAKKMSKELDKCLTELNLETQEFEPDEEVNIVSTTTTCIISISTLQLCDKLITKEKISNQIMGYPVSTELEVAEGEIKKNLVGFGG